MEQGGEEQREGRYRETMLVCSAIDRRARIDVGASNASRLCSTAPPPLPSRRSALQAMITGTQEGGGAHPSCLFVSECPKLTRPHPP